MYCLLSDHAVFPDRNCKFWGIMPLGTLLKCNLLYQSFQFLLVSEGYDGLKRMIEVKMAKRIQKAHEVLYKVLDVKIWSRGSSNCWWSDDWFRKSWIKAERFFPVGASLISKSLSSDDELENKDEGSNGFDWISVHVIDLFLRSELMWLQCCCLAVADCSLTCPKIFNTD